MARQFLIVSLLGMGFAAAQTNSLCARIIDLQLAAQAANPSERPIAIPIKPTLDCLQNITFGQFRTYNVGAMLDQMSVFLDWETDLDTLKSPPSDWPYPAHDVTAKLAEVKAKANSNAYKTEYDFAKDILENVFLPAHSGHFVWYPDMLTTPWYWARRVSLVSISKDGTALPQIFFRDDILKSPSTASPLTKIDGVDASKFIEDLVFKSASQQDPDAGYNAMFHNKAYVAAKISNGGYFAAQGRNNMIYPGDSTTYTFANGTSVTVGNVALLKRNFTGVTETRYFMARYQGEGSSGEVPVSISYDSPGYPTPVITTQDGTLAGYYLQGDGLNDIAVLSILSFSPKSVAEYQKVAQTFLADAKRDGKKKLVLDLSANNGGYILSGYDLFRQLFPQTVQSSPTRFRRNRIFDTSARVADKIIGPTFDPNTATDPQIYSWLQSWNYRYDLRVDGKHFSSPDDKFGPHPYKQSNFTSLQEWDLDDVVTTVKGNYAFGVEITGYGSRKNFTQPFAAEDIIILTDGFCASTCFLFTDFLKRQAGVKSVVVGGRPNTSPMQTVGGVKGGQLNTWNDLYQEVYRSALNLWRINMSDPDYAYLRKEWIDHLEFKGWASNAGINLRDVVRDGEGGLPAHFVKENADCRLFYTRDMIVDVQNVWSKAAGVAWNGGKCVAGGLSKRDVVRSEGVKKRAAPSAPIKTKLVSFEEETVVKDAEWKSKHGRKALE